MPIILPNTNKNLNVASEALKNGKLIAYPTETLYGLGANAYNDEAVKSVFIAKKREEKKPITVNYLNFNDAEKDFFITEDAKKVANLFLPGPLTIILRKKCDSKLSKYLSPNENIGIRVSSHPILRQIMEKISFPITASSANLNNSVTKNAQDIAQNFLEMNHLIIIDTGECFHKQASTIIDLTKNPFRFVRIGAISEAEFYAKFESLKKQKEDKSIFI